jgi:hypothetical protein
MTKQTKKLQQKYATEFDDMVDLTLTYLEHIASLFPTEFPKLLVLLEAIESGEINEVAADLRQLLRDFKLSGDFEADVERYINAVKAADASAVLEARLEALAENDPIRLKAKRFVDVYGESGTWAQMQQILAE